MERAVIAALSKQLGRHVDLSKPRLETRSMLAVGMISARTVNLAHVADGRGLARWTRPRLAGGCSGSSSMSGCPTTGSRR
jgi:hypothetical protein